MTSDHPVLVFGTAHFHFRDMEQMQLFVEGWCYMGKSGRIYLHHGFQYHVFTELRTDSYDILPKELHFVRQKRTQFMMGRVNKNK